MKHICAHTEIVELHKLQPNPRNPNKHPDRQIELLAKIIDYQGQRAPIVVSKLSGFITKGHGRLMALQKLGWESAAVDYQDYESEAQEYADLIADNKIAELAKHDDLQMIEDLKTLDIDDFELLGMDDFNLPMDADEAKDAIEDDVPTDVETRCKEGDLWILGEHRLLCGDATNIQHVEKLMNGEKADMVFTDPPYGMNLDTDYSKMPGTSSKYKKVEGDNEKYDCGALMTLVEAKQYYIWGADYFFDTIPKFFEGSIIVWTKRQSEIENKVFGSAFELCWSYPKQKKVVWFERGINQSSERLGEHPTQKPIALTTRTLEKHKDYKNIVDLFGGSGSTLIACEKTNRKCYMMELDPHYCDVILKRWEAYSDKVATLETHS